MSYSLQIEKKVIKFLSKLDKDTSRRILSKIKNLSNNPNPHDSKRLVNIKDSVFRIRIGFFRVLYRIENNEIIIVFLIDKRSKVYKK